MKPTLIDAMDLVVSVCTGPAHIAGAMGKPVWTLVAEPPDLRWLTSREDSPWYPTMRLFRQRTQGRWDDVIARVARELARGPDAWRALATRTGRAVGPPPAVVPAPSRDALPHLAETRQGLLMFDPAEPDVVDTDIAQHVRRKIAVRVAALVLADEPDPFHLQVSHTERLIGRHLTTDVGKVLAFADAVGDTATLVAFTVAKRTTESGGGLIGVAAALRRAKGPGP